MPVDSLHPEYRKNSPKWVRCRDAYEGSDAIKAKNTVYLPKLTKQKYHEYQAYKNRALFYSITSKTLSALVGMAMTRQPNVEFPEDMHAYYTDDKGVQFLENLSKTLTETLLLGRLGILVDRPDITGEPQILFYTAESIINWRTDKAGKPTMIILEECILVPGKDEYELVEVIQYRRLELIDNVYYVSIFNKKQEVVQAPFAPTNQGKAMDFIPFYMVHPYGMGFEVEKPPVLDIVDINISHYRTSADLEHGRHFTALPTPYVTGVQGGTELAIGSTTAWVLPDVNCKAAFLEFEGLGLQSLEKALQEKQAQLASLSARLLDNSKRGSEASETVRLRYMSETASLAGVVRAAEAVLTMAYRAIATMRGDDPKKVVIDLNKEFLDVNLSPSEIVDLIDSFLMGGISEKTLVFNLRRGNIIPREATDADEEAALVTAKEAAARKAALASARTKTPPQE